MPLGSQPGHVHVVDDDPQFRGAVVRLLAAAGIPAEEWDSGTAFLRQASFAPPACVLLDLDLPGASGLEVQAELRRRGLDLPVVFLTAHGGISSAVQAMKEGALDFLEKPAAPEQLLAAVGGALRRSRERAEAEARREGLARRLGSLTPRELEVLRLLAAGATDEAGAAALGLSEDAVKIHRLRVMEKMAAGSLAELAQMAMALGLVAPRAWG